MCFNEEKHYQYSYFTISEGDEYLHKKILTKAYGGGGYDVKRI